jgi:predicted nucleic acid-binding protein
MNGHLAIYIQLAIYIKDRLAERLEKAVKASGLSKSRWVAAAIERSLQDHWPDGLFDLVESFKSTLDIVPFHDASSRSSAKIRAALVRKGTPIGPMDLLITSICMTYNFRRQRIFDH